MNGRPGAFAGRLAVRLFLARRCLTGADRRGTNLANGSFTQILAGDTNASWPLWRPDGQAIYYVGYPRGFGQS